MAKTQITGNLTKELSMHYTPRGKAVTNFKMAEDIKNPQTKEVAYTNWWKVVAWEELAEAANQVLAKGSFVRITGMVKLETWEYEGKNYSTLAMTASEILLWDKQAKKFIPVGSQQPPAAKQPAPSKWGDYNW